MGKTVETYRMALDDEISRWKGFAKALRQEDREAFEALIDACRGYASAGSNAVQPVLFEPMIMSMLLSQQVHLQRLQKELDDLKRKGA
jgi:hypothetical protein